MFPGRRQRRVWDLIILIVPVPVPVSVQSTGGSCPGFCVRPALKRSCCRETLQSSGPCAFLTSCCRSSELLCERGGAASSLPVESLHSPHFSIHTPGRFIFPFPQPCRGWVSRRFALASDRRRVCFPPSVSLSRSLTLIHTPGSVLLFFFSSSVFPPRKRKRTAPVSPPNRALFGDGV